MKASLVLSRKVSEILLRIEHVSIFPTSYLPNFLDEPRFIVDDLNFPFLVQMLWTAVCGVNKTTDLPSRYSTFSLQCFLEDNRDCNKKFNEWTKAADTIRDSTSYRNILWLVTYAKFKHASLPLTLCGPTSSLG